MKMASKMDEKFSLIGNGNDTIKLRVWPRIEPSNEVVLGVF